MLLVGEHLASGVRHREVARLLDELEHLAPSLRVPVAVRPVAHRPPLAVVQTQVAPGRDQLCEDHRVAAVAGRVHRGATLVAPSAAAAGISITPRCSDAPYETAAVNSRLSASSNLFRAYFVRCFMTLETFY